MCKSNQEKDFRLNLPDKIKSILMARYKDENNRATISLLASDFCEMFETFEEDFDSAKFCDFTRPVLDGAEELVNEEEEEEEDD